MTRDILFLAHRVPYPPDRGDKIRAFHELVHLSRRHRVHLVAFADDPRDMHHRESLGEWAESVVLLPRTKSRARAAAEALASGRPVSITAFADRAMEGAVAATLRDRAIGGVLVFSGQMAQYLPPHAPGPVVMDFCDVDSAKFAAYAGRGAWPMRWMMRREARLLSAFEARVARRVDASLFVSAAEAKLFARTAGIGGTTVVENGIDTTRFDPAERFDPVDPGPAALIFTGQMDYPPNIDAVTWFADAVLPAIRARRPDVRFVICGRAPTAAVQALAKRDNVIVTGEVDDVRGWLTGAAIAVAPLRVARGVQNKVLEAMAMARPVVASGAAAEGIDHAGTIRVADDGLAFVAAIDALLGDPAAATRLGEQARARVEARYGWDARLALLDALFDGVPLEDAA